MKEKLAYSGGEPVGNWVGWVPKGMANQVFNMQLGIDPTLISLSFVIFRLWDAVTDLFMAGITDNFRSRWGRRRPFIFVGAIAMAILFPTLWWVNPDWSQYRIITWFIIAGILLYTAQTVFNMPWQSLLLEMTPDYHERTRISAWRAFAGKAAGLFGGWTWAFTQLPIFHTPGSDSANTLVGMQWASLILAVFILILGLLPAIFCKERYYKTATKRKQKIPMKEAFGNTFKNKPFWIICGLIMVMTLGVGMVNSFGTYVIKYYVFAGDGAAASILHGWGSSIGSFSGMLLLPVWAWAARRYGKEKALLSVLVAKFLMIVSVWWTYNPNHPWLAVTHYVLQAPINSGLWMIIPSMIADVVDFDELKTGQRREGNYSAVFSWIVKASQSVGFGIAGPLLVMTGLDAQLGAIQPDGVIRNMRLTMIIVPAVGMVLTWFLVFLYPLNEQKMHDIRFQLEARRGRLDGDN
jgi:GPH family glycoside/pentoside/hexuronide:cation symporter